MPILLKKVTVWFQNAHQRRKEGHPKKTSKATADGRAAITWTARKVIKEQMADELKALILKQDPSAKSGEHGYLKHVQRCLSKLVKRLSKDELKKYEDVAALRNAVGVDPELKAK